MTNPAIEDQAPARRYPAKATSLSTAELQLIESRVTNEGPSAGVAWLLLLFLGFLGAHRFYLGRVGSGILMVLSMLVLVGFLWWFIDLFLLNGMIRARRAEIRQKLIWQAEGQLPA